MPVSISPPCFPGQEIGNLLAGEARKTREEVKEPSPCTGSIPPLWGSWAPWLHSPQPHRSRDVLHCPMGQITTGALVIPSILQWQTGKCQLDTQTSASAEA